MNETITYFEYAGKDNREAIATIIESVLENEAYNYLVVPTSTGANLDALIERNIHERITIVAVVIHNGFKGGDKNRMPREKMSEYMSMGIDIFQGTHSLSGIERSISRKFGGISPVEIMAETLKIFGGDGFKVASEIAVMASDAGLLPTDETVLVAGGTSGGMDTLVSMISAHMNNFFTMNIERIYAKPLTRKNKE